MKSRERAHSLTHTLSLTAEDMEIKQPIVNAGIYIQRERRTK